MTSFDTAFDAEVQSVREWMSGPRFDGLLRLYSARQVAEQRGAIGRDYTVARRAAEGFWTRLRELFAAGRGITTFGPYSPGQAVAMKRAGIEAVYLGGWATSAKGSEHEDPGPDLASYPLSRVPDEGAALVRALLTADRNQRFLRSRMSAGERARTPEVDYSPFVIADADTGHGGDPHVRNLIRLFVEAGIPGYHIEDQKPGEKKCGHQGGKVLVPVDEQIKRLNAARFQLDVMGVPGVIVARTDAESASLLHGDSDERDQPFILGATAAVPSYRVAFLTLLKLLSEAGVEGVSGHRLYALNGERCARAEEWMQRAGVLAAADAAVAEYRARPSTRPDEAVDAAADALVEAWQSAARLMTCAEAVAEEITARAADGEQVAMSAEEWTAFAGTADLHGLRGRAAQLGLDSSRWDPRLAQTPEGYYQVRGGIDYAVAKSLAVAPFCDILWMETKTADLADAEAFARAVHAVHPDKMLAYNLSPSFSWDTTGMTEAEMRDFPAELGRMGYVFNFITYGGHQIDGMASEEFAAALAEEGMLALAKLQRRFRLVDSPYKTPQTLVGGPRLDAALMASSGRTATTRAMGKGSTQFQHLVPTEAPTTTLEGWLARWADHHRIASEFRVRLLPYTAGSEILELSAQADGETASSLVFAVLKDRRGRAILSVRDQNTAPAVRRKRLTVLLHLFLVLRYKVDSVHYLTPTEDNRRQTASMRQMGIFRAVSEEVGEIIVADINAETVAELLSDDGALRRLVERGARPVEAAEPRG